MKAAVWTEYGPPDVLQIKEVEKPTPKDDEVLIKVHAATVTSGDCEMRDLKFPLFLALLIRLYTGIRRPKRITILGQEISGVIEDVGENVTRYKKGDQVFATTGFKLGGYAEYICLTVDEPGVVMAIKPSIMSFDEAATVPVGGLNALYFLREGDIRQGQKILINGAGGSVGTYAVQIAKSYGLDVTCVDSTEKLDMLRSIGADDIIDYKKEDFIKKGEKCDVIFDVVGKSSFSGCMKSLNRNGILLLGNPSLYHKIRGKIMSLVGSKKVFYSTASYKPEDLIFLKELIEDGKIKSVIDKRYPLEKIVEAHRYVETGAKRGNVAIIVF